MNKINYSFKDWCEDNNRVDILERWDYELNKITPSEINYKSNKKYYFLCPRHLHESQLSNIQYFSSGKQKNLVCKKCKSFAQYILDNYSQEYLELLIQINPNINLWDIGQKSNSHKLNIKCFKKGHKYLQTPEHFVKNGCQYCSHRIQNCIDKEESLGFLYPKMLPLWSDKNKQTPYDYYPYSTSKVFWKCENNIHEDYNRAISVSNTIGFRCPKCVNFWGENNANWKGGNTYKDKKERQSYQYLQWRKQVKEKDNYTCQCCLNKIDDIITGHVHHIYNFADYKDLRMDINNGITLCQNCHQLNIEDSFHNIYGNFHTTPEQLDNYINYKRKKLGINIPFNINKYMQKIV